jgi:methyltransferase family protein
VTLRSRCRGTARWIALTVLPRFVLRRLKPSYAPLPGRVRFGDLRRARPFSVHFGFERGLPVDRHYIERFLEQNRADIRGRVLEVGDASYTRRFGGDRVTHSDVLHVEAGAPEATVVADLSDADHLPGDAFDCIILTQTLHLVYDFTSAVATVRRVLAPGGVVLVTVPGISQIDAGEWAHSWYWSFTAPAVGRMFGEEFGPANVSVTQHGSVLSAIAFLEGMASRELTEAELAVDDPAYPVFIGVRAVKATTP